MPIGGGACLAAFLMLPRLGWLQWLGAYSLTIYLYHIMAASFSRRALLAAGVTSPWVLVLAGTVLGIACPVVLHLICQRFGPTRLLVLGLRDRAPRAAPLARPA